MPADLWQTGSMSMLRNSPVRLVFGLAALLVAACSGSSDDNRNAFDTDQILDIAHRGGNTIAPEATIEAFSAALEVGADVLEFDVRTTSDGVLVVIHDDRVDRTTNGSGFVNELTVAEIQELDAGYNYTQDGGETYPYRGQGLQVPQLDEVLAAFPGVPVNIEIKSAVALSDIPALADSLRAYNRTNKALVASFSQDHISAFREAAPEIWTAFSQDEVTYFFLMTPELEESYEPPSPALQVPPTFSGLTVLTPEFVAKARRFGLRVDAFDINTAERIQEMLDLGLNGMITNDPALLREMIDAES
jgi:glycerophosphoryl diester phosphodiesterase